MSARQNAETSLATSRLASYLSLSAAGAIAGNGMAEVVHIPAENLPVELVSDQQLFLFFSLRTPGVLDSHDFRFNPVSSYGGTFIVLQGAQQPGAQILISDKNITGGAATSVGPGTSVDATLADPPLLQWTNGFPLDPEAFDGTDRFLPVRFPAGGDFNYGFIEIEVTPEGNLRISDAAWGNRRRRRNHHAFGHQ
jgi:hypothetical protein